MKNFKEFKDIIYKTIEDINSKDPNYDWSVHSFGKDKVTISWSYLDKGTYFSIKCEEIEEDGMCFITSRDAIDDKMINGHFAQEQDGGQKFYSESYEHAIECAIREIHSHANYCY